MLTFPPETPDSVARKGFNNLDALTPGSTYITTVSTLSCILVLNLSPSC